MARVLAISSYVVHGHVGLCAIVPALQAIGHEVMAVPSVVLSNHYGYRNVTGVDVAAVQLTAILEGLKANGWLDNVDAVITGYLPSPEHVEAITAMLARLGETLPDVLYLCDPVLGDDPDGLYVSAELAAAVRDALVPLADVVTPNRFELAWLTGSEVASAADANRAAKQLGDDVSVVTTSIPAGDGLIENVLAGWREDDVIVVHERSGVPRGTGDLFAALYLGFILDEYDESDALAKATGVVDEVVEASLGREELQIAGILFDVISGGDA
ncbi:MAG: pyridoxal kinase [Alphaproteobacteria bacterium]|nr:pyridoxal kinase [Alphaproteobacteria bacterium]